MFEVRKLYDLNYIFYQITLAVVWTVNDREAKVEEGLLEEAAILVRLRNESGVD